MKVFAISILISMFVFLTLGLLFGCATTKPKTNNTTIIKLTATPTCPLK